MKQIFPPKVIRIARFRQRSCRSHSINNLDDTPFLHFTTHIFTQLVVKLPPHRKVGYRLPFERELIERDTQSEHELIQLFSAKMINTGKARRQNRKTLQPTKHTLKLNTTATSNTIPSLRKRASCVQQMKDELPPTPVSKPSLSLLH